MGGRALLMVAGALGSIAIVALMWLSSEHGAETVEGSPLEVRSERALPELISTEDGDASTTAAIVPSQLESADVARARIERAVSAKRRFS